MTLVCRVSYTEAAAPSPPSRTGGSSQLSSGQVAAPHIVSGVCDPWYDDDRLLHRDSKIEPRLVNDVMFLIAGEILLSQWNDHTGRYSIDRKSHVLWTENEALSGQREQSDLVSYRTDRKK